MDVLVDARVPHLARTFTYAVPPRLAAAVVPGVRVRVRLSGQLTEGYVTGPGSDFGGSLMPIESLVSPVPVLTDAVLSLCEHVAHHYAGSLSDVVRLAIPRVPNVAGSRSNARLRAGPHWQPGSPPSRSGWQLRQANPCGRPGRHPPDLPGRTNWRR